MLNIASEYMALLHQHQLDSFEKIWAYKGDWYEPPNHGRGGWSGVNYIALFNDVCQVEGFYLKRQEGHLRRTILHPIKGEPTFLREFQVIQHLKKNNVTVPQLIFFSNEQKKSILLTLALENYVSLERWLENNIQNKGTIDLNLIAAVAREVRKMHQANVQHRSLYTKHIFVNENSGNYKVALIDFEKSRITPFISFLRFSDLITFSYRTQNISSKYKLFFFKQYLGIQRLSLSHKLICRYIQKKSSKKLKNI